MRNASASATITVRVYSCQNAAQLSRNSLRLSGHRVAGLLPRGMIQSVRRMRSLQSAITNSACCNEVIRHAIEYLCASI